MLAFLTVPISTPFWSSWYI